MPQQADALIRLLKNETFCDWKNDWKMITVFVGVSQAKIYLFNRINIAVEFFNITIIFNLVYKRINQFIELIDQKLVDETEIISFFVFLKELSIVEVPLN